ncbi:metallophosphoesterase [Chitinophaga pinensis]|uniref:Metallophosphoesterase n=1 Tax=Chitinophaga pinensis (strain ATCC 43595 / DSM 2588 / LMG 13176 / NBRC 15968 / NCIMB 11800 / UQM 2034) TaxID=485918 RepID=A0A979G1Q8_CHIPD|nr:metallophosphoesterase [Chitinophaga pinensis]ACU59249.1 metallophosphoesterase [Chitinophaga pinensis DSM 2588]
MSRTFVVGDIHGCFDELIQLTDLMGLQPEDLLLSVGDIVDRGAKSREVYEYFRNRPNSKVLMGNHERKHLNGVLSYAQEIVKLQFGERYPAFLEWCATLEYFHETPEAIIVHAAFEHDVPLSAQREEVLCGATAGERYLEKKYGTAPEWVNLYPGNKPLIYGHHVTGALPEIKNNTWGIDTGACHAGYLTAIELPGFIIHQVKVERDYWKEEQVTWQIPVLKSKDWENMTFEQIQKQLEKLAYIEVPEVKGYLSAIAQWSARLSAMYPALITGIGVFVQQLTETHGEQFSIVANQYAFKTYLFKSKAGNLKVADMEKSLNTPAKIIALAAALGMSL